MKSGKIQTIKIEGFHSPYITPPVPELSEIDGHDLPKSKQKWIRPILPDDDDADKMSDKEKAELIYREFIRRLRGYWFMNNGEPTYITGDYYFYLTYWFIGAITKDGYPEYRKANRDWMYVVDFCEKDSNCMGLIAMCQKRDGKALSLDTDIPTPSGWVKMADVNIGDYVFGEDGKPTRVTFISDIQHNRNCYEILFSDGSTVIADEDHRWLASNVQDRAYRENRNSSERTIKQRVVTTNDLLQSVLTDGGTSNWSIENCNPVQYDSKHLEIPPYIFGLWIGDGSKDNAILTSVDGEIIKDWFDYGLSIGLTPKTRNITHSLLTSENENRNLFVNKLKLLGVHKNKHIPTQYLQSSIDDRIALLQGLMDSDGTTDISSKRNAFSFCNKNRNVVLGVKELLESLGIKSKLHEVYQKKEVEPTYYLKFLSYDIEPFRLKRKLDKTNRLQIKNSPSKRRFIKSITKVDSVPVKCIQVDNNNHTYLCTKSFIVTHNTERHLSTLYNRATLIDENCLFGMQSLNATEAKNNLFKSRLMRSHKLIPNYLKPVSNETTSKKEIISELTFKGENVGKGKYKAGLNNVIDWRPTLANAYQGKRPKMIFIDEPGSIDEMDLEEWWTTVKQQLVLGKSMFGKAYLPTTLESMTPKGAAKYQKLWDESDPDKIDGNGRTQSGLYRYFKPHYKGREGFIDEFGNDLEEDAIKFRQNELDNANIDNQRKIKRQYPANVEEAFDIDFGGGLDSDAIEILKQRKREILKDDSIKRVAHKIFEYNGEIHTTAIGKSTGGDLIIFEGPKPNVKYRIGVDGTGTDKQTSDSKKKKSKYSVSVTKLFDPEPNARSYCDVAEFTIEPEKQEECFRLTFLICRLYNKYDNCKILPEGNIGTAPAIVGYFENRGGLKMMLKQPKYLGTDSKETLNRFCFYRDGTVLETQILLLNQAIRMYGHFINSVDLIDDLLRVGKSNADLASAYMAAILGWGGFSNPEGRKEKPKQKWMECIGRDANGVQIWKERG